METKDFLLVDKKKTWTSLPAVNMTLKQIILSYTQDSFAQ